MELFKCFFFLPSSMSTKGREVQRRYINALQDVAYLQNGYSTGPWKATQEKAQNAMRAARNAAQRAKRVTFSNSVPMNKSLFDRKISSSVKVQYPRRLAVTRRVQSSLRRMSALRKYRKWVRDTEKTRSGGYIPSFDEWHSLLQGSRNGKRNAGALWG